MCLGVLYHAGGVGGDAVAFAAVPFHVHLVELSVAYRRCREVQLPCAVAQGLEAVFGLFLPSGEIPYKVYCRGVGRPFAEYPPSAASVQPEILVGVGEVGEGVAFLGEIGLFALRVEVSPVNGRSERFKPGIVFIDG